MGDRNIFWRKFDPDNYIYDRLSRLKNQRVAGSWALAFVTLKWISFVSSVDDLILRSKPVKWCGEKIDSAIIAIWPSIKPLGIFVATFTAHWASLWRAFVSPIYKILSVFKIFHVPEFVLAVASDAIMLVLLPTCALITSWITSAGIRAEAHRLRRTFDAKVALTVSPDKAEARLLRAQEYATIYGRAFQLMDLSLLVRDREVDRLMSRLRTGRLRMDANGTPTPEQQFVLDQVSRAKQKSIWQTLSDASPTELRSAYNSRHHFGEADIHKDELEHFIRHIDGKHLGLNFSDPATVKNNLQLLQAQQDASFYVFKAVSLSLVLAVTACLLRIIEQIWF